MFDFNVKYYSFGKLIACIILNVLGLIFIQSSLVGQSGSFMGQFVISIFSLIFCILISFLNLKKIMVRPELFIWLAIVLLVLVRIIGTAFGRNSVRWIPIPIINMQLQPSEFAKLLLILFMSVYIDRFGKQINQFRNFVKVLIYFAIPFLLIFFQPNLSSAIIFFVIFFGMLGASKLKSGYLLTIIGMILFAGLLIFISVKFGFIQKMPLLKDYQKNRIVSFFEQTGGKDESRYQQENSVIAIGSGKLFGKGIGNDSPDSVKNGNWLAEAQNDFIFAIVGEEVGFVGSAAIVLLYIYLIISCVLTGSGQREGYKNLICIGVATWIGIQAFINLAVATSMIPNTGVPLPFFSQGGSALMSIYMAMGFVLNISRGV